MKDGAESSVQADIPAQDYETDILPRYKEALSLGLTSCRNHLQSTKKGHSTSSVFRVSFFMDDYFSFYKYMINLVYINICIGLM